MFNAESILGLGNGATLGGEVGVTKSAAGPATLFFGRHKLLQTKKRM